VDRPKVSGVVLAAGPSRRFGDSPPKQLLRIGGVPLVRRIVERAAASRLREVLVVVGKAADEVVTSCAGLQVEFVRNPRYAQGQSLSVKLGLAAIDPTSRGAMFIPVDQPGLSVELLDSMIERYLETGGPIVVPTYAGQRGAPVIFDRSLFEELGKIEGDTGGRQLFARHAAGIVELPLDSELALRDLDTMEDLEELDV
jgi:molybdenum cofactor cytidylyltransferase